MPRIDIDIPYGTERLRFGLPAANLRGVFQPGSHEPSAVADARSEIKRALAEPIGSPSLRDLAAGARHVVLVADDMTRPTPVETIAPILLDELNSAGVPDSAIEVLIALGTHRAMSEGEIIARFGSATVDRVPVINHDAFDRDILASVGQTPSGVEVLVNRRAMEADLVVGIGNIVPHHIPGFSGGAKIIQPGICGEQTTGHVHLLSVRHPHSLLGVLENQVRVEMELIAERAGLKAVLNTVLDRHGRLLRAVFGDPRKAFRAGAALSRKVYGVQVGGLSDIVVASSHPCDIEFWQAHKTLYAAALCVRPGGTIVIVTPCPEGLAVTHPDLTAFAGMNYEDLDAAIHAGEIHDLTAGALALAWANTRRRARVMLVSEGITDQVARAVGFDPRATIDEALEDAWKHHGRDATVAVLPSAPDTLPLIASA